MDKDNKPKRPQKHAASLDGIVPDGRKLGVHSQQPYQPNRGQTTPTLGSFEKRSDGFFPMRQVPYGLGQTVESAEADALFDEPIVLDEVDKKRTHGSLVRRSRRRKILKRISLFLAAVLLVGGAYYGFKFYQTQRKILAGGGQAPAVCDVNVNAGQLKGEGDGRVNILLLGNGGAEHSDGPDLTDTILIASIDTVNNKAALLSIPRDLWVKIPGNGSRKLNEAYFHGKEDADTKDKLEQKREGVATVDKTLESIIGVPIHYHVLITFAGFRQAVDAVGGVDINVPQELAVKETLWDEFTRKNYKLNVQAGRQHFDGQRALFFARSRYTSPRGDFDRSERQRLVLVALKDKALSAGTYSNPIKVSSLLDSLGDNVYTDFDTGSIKCIYKEMSEIPSSSIASLDLVTPPHDFLTSGHIPGSSTYVPKAGTYDYSAIQNYVRNALKDSFLAKENSSIAVYNATSTVGLAAKKADELKSYGYNITTVDNAQATDPAKTVIIDLTKGSHKYTKHYLESRFGVSSTTSLTAAAGIKPPAGTNFVIILGEDAANPR